jgi:hypothetical protein
MNPIVPTRLIQSEKDSRGRITHWHCSACQWTTLGAGGSSSAMALQAICDAFGAHVCKSYKSTKVTKSTVSKAVA